MPKFWDGYRFPLQLLMIMIISFYTFSTIPSSVLGDTRDRSDVIYKEILVLVEYDDFKISIEMNEGDTIQYNWSSDKDITFQIDDGGWGSAPVYLTQDHGDGIFTAPKNNTYIIRFESKTRDVNTTVDYEIHVKRFQKNSLPNGEEEKEESSTFPMIAIILGIISITVISLVVIITVIIVLMKKKPKEPSQY